MYELTSNRLEDTLERAQSRKPALGGLAEFSLADMSRLNRLDRAKSASSLPQLELSVAPLDGKPPLKPAPSDQHPTRDSRLDEQREFETAGKTRRRLGNGSTTDERDAILERRWS
ncbi:MAG: hypothetical protein IPM23_21650 [Candidatus Melainabacteria bacterium]|nr:hypothetical protein [Candidatus Melainabacteria bacterium]